jgi:hypothetical protein
MAAALPEIPTSATLLGPFPSDMRIVEIRSFVRLTVSLPASVDASDHVRELSVRPAATRV